MYSCYSWWKWNCTHIFVQDHIQAVGAVWSRSCCSKSNINTLHVTTVTQTLKTLCYIILYSKHLGTTRLQWSKFCYCENPQMLGPVVKKCSSMWFVELTACNRDRHVHSKKTGCCCLSDEENEILFRINVPLPVTMTAGMDRAGKWFGLPGHHTSHPMGTY